MPRRAKGTIVFWANRRRRPVLPDAAPLRRFVVRRTVATRLWYVRVLDSKDVMLCVMLCVMSCGIFLCFMCQNMRQDICQDMCRLMKYNLSNPKPGRVGRAALDEYERHDLRYDIISVLTFDINDITHHCTYM